jgi:hypothetical protein
MYNITLSKRQYLLKDFSPILRNSMSTSLQKKKRELQSAAEQTEHPNFQLRIVITVPYANASSILSATLTLLQLGL